MGLDDIRELSGRLTEIITDSQTQTDWARMGEAIAAILPGTVSCIVRVEADPQIATQTHAFGFRPGAVDAYENYYSAINPWMPGFMALPSGEVANMKTDLPREAYENTEFYNDFILPHGGIDAGISTKVIGDDKSFLMLFMQYPKQHSEHYDMVGSGVINELLPILKGVIDMSSRSMEAWLDGACESALGVAEAQGQHGFVIDRSRMLEKATVGAVGILESAAGIIARQGRIQFENPADDKWLSDSLRLLHRMKDARSVARTLQLGNAFQRAQLWRLVRPSIGVPGLIKDRYALILSHLEALDTNSGTLEIARHYGLSPSETQVVSELAEDRTLNEIADRLEVSIHTIRSQIKSAMRKAECHRQSELVAKVYRFSS